MDPQEKYEIFRKIAKAKRNCFINSEEYATFLINLYVQLLNLDASHYSVKDFTIYKPNIEILSLYSDYVRLNVDNFQGRNIDKILKSIDNSIYSAIETSLVSFEIEKLDQNSLDSFLVLPLTFAFFDTNENQFKLHELGAIIRKKNMYIQLEIIDKSTIPIDSRRTTMSDIKNKNIYKNNKGIVSYCYDISLNRINDLSNILYLGLVNPQIQADQIKEYMENKQEVLFSYLSEICSSEYYGERVATYQYLLGNCLAKETEATIKFALGEEKYVILSKENPMYVGEGIQAKYLHETKLPYTQSNKQNYLDLAAILLDRLEKLQFDKNICKNYLFDAFSTYSYLKDCRVGDCFKKSIQSALSSKVYEKSSYSVSKNERTSIECERLTSDLNNVALIKRELGSITYYSHTLTKMKEEAKDYSFFRRQLALKSIER